MASSNELRATHLITVTEAFAAHKDAATFLEVHPWRTRQGDDPIVGHVPDAFVTGITTHFAGAATGVSGRLPLPDPADLAQAAAGWGVDVGTPIIVYARHADEFSTAARAWFTLRWAGFTNVRVLDGQLPAWADAGHPLGDAAAPRKHSPAPTLVGGALPTLDADAAAAVAQSGSLLDARSSAAYSGHEADPRTGHIPGALHAPSSELIAEGHLRASADIRKWLLRHHAIGQPAGAYCGAGVGSATTVFAAATVGEPLPLYVASWSGWSADANAPVEQGAGQGLLIGADC